MPLHQPPQLKHPCKHCIVCLLFSLSKNRYSLVLKQRKERRYGKSSSKELPLRTALDGLYYSGSF